jgi:hypothetical protein
MATTSSKTDIGIGLGLLFSILAISGAIATAVFGYTYAIHHAAGEASRALQVNSGVAFGIAMTAGALAIVAIHLYDS